MLIIYTILIWGNRQIIHYIVYQTLQFYISVTILTFFIFKIGRPTRSQQKLCNHVNANHLVLTYVYPFLQRRIVLEAQHIFVFPFVNFKAMSGLNFLSPRNGDFCMSNHIYIAFWNVKYWHWTMYCFFQKKTNPHFYGGPFLISLLKNTCVGFGC